MTEDTKAQSGAADTAKLALAIALVIGGLAGYYVLGSAPLWERWVPVVAGILLGAAVLVPSRYGRDLRQFWVAARVELNKVVWPTRQETGMTTLVVFGFVILAGVFFWGVDLVLAWATRHLTGQGG